MNDFKDDIRNAVLYACGLACGRVAMAATEKARGKLDRWALAGGIVGSAAGYVVGAAIYDKVIGE